MDTVEFKPSKQSRRAFVVASACAGIVFGIGIMQTTSNSPAAPSGTTSVDALGGGASQHGGTALNAKPASSSSAQSSRQCVVASTRTPAQRRSDRVVRQLLPMSADAITEWLQGSQVRRTN